MLELDQPTEQRELSQRRYPREAEPSRFFLALVCALSVNALAFGWLGAGGPPTVVDAPRVMRLSALRQVSKMASHAQRALSAPPVSTPAAVRSGGGRRWFGARGTSPAPARGWAWWPARGTASGGGSAAPRRPAASQPSLAGPANTWSGPLATGGAGPVVGPVTRVAGNGANGRDDDGPAGHGHEPASVGTSGPGHGVDQPGGSPLALASGRAVGDGLPGPASSGSAEPVAVVHRGGGRPAPGGAVDIDVEPAPRPAPSAAPAASVPEPARPAVPPRPEPALAARPEPKPDPRPEPKPEAKPEARPEPAAPKPEPKPEPKPDLPNTPRVLSRSAPSFPPVDKSGSVTIAIHVSASGAVTSVEVTSSSGIGGVDAAARSAGRRFRFSRAENGKTFYQTFRYSPK